MGVNIEKLKLDIIRKTIYLENGDEINIYNPIGEYRQELMLKLNNDEINEEEKINKLFPIILSDLTDLEVGNIDNIEEVFNSPSGYIIEIQSEIQEILHELQCEILTNKLAQLNQLETLKLTELSLKKLAKIEKLNCDIEKLDQDIELEEN